jgi:hypothetical protein
MEPMETVAAPCDMMTLFERAFNGQLCKELADAAEKNTTTITPVYINGTRYNARGNSLCVAQILEMTKRNWCGTTYKVMYREEGQKDEEMKELRIGKAVRIKDHMAFRIIRDDVDNWAEEQMLTRRMMRL